ncbi:MAG TPA: nuclear transport factor 2 family protein, partial [Rhodoferax sp.]
AAVVPSATTAPVNPAKVAASDSKVKDVEEAVQAWAKAWSTKDMTAYLGAYGKEFNPAGKQSRSAWEAERRNRIVGKTAISVKLEKLSVTINGANATARFRQDYRAGALAVSSRKTLELVRNGSRWLIVKESTGN